MKRPLEIRVPGKVILFGEWAVTRGGLGLASTVDRDLNLTWTPGAFGGELRLSGSSPDRAPCSEVFHSGGELERFVQAKPDAYLHLAAATLARKHFFAPGSAHLRCEWLASDGLGSSSAVVAALLALTTQASDSSEADLGLAHSDVEAFVREITRRPQETDWTPAQRKALWREGREILRTFDSPRASGLDLAVQVMGGSLALKGDAWEPQRFELPGELWLLHTGQKISTREWLGNFEPDPAWLATIGKSAEDFLRHRDWERTIREHFGLFRETPLVPREVLDFETEQRAAGNIRALKTTGAGGGDALLCLITPGRDDAVLSALQSRGWRRGSTGDRFQTRGLEIH